jgi:hypothetical protein
MQIVNEEGSGFNSMERRATMDTRKLVVCLALVVFGFYIAVASPAEAGTTTSKSTASGSFVSDNFDFDDPTLSSPATYGNAAGTNTISGGFTSQGNTELAPDGNKCTLPGGVTGAGTEFALVGDLSVARDNKSGDLLFGKGTSETECIDFSTFPTPPFPFVFTEKGVFTGGTGALSGATGTFTAKGKGATLSIDATGVRVFGWFTFHSTDTVAVPDN